MGFSTASTFKLLSLESIYTEGGVRKNSSSGDKGRLYLGGNEVSNCISRYGDISCPFAVICHEDVDGATEGIAVTLVRWRSEPEHGRKVLTGQVCNSVVHPPPFPE